MYLMAVIRSCTLNGSLSCLTPSFCAMKLVSSCNAPNGQSQPQKKPRFHISAPKAVAHQRMKITGSIKKTFQLKP